jgi:hypothetical protein
MAQQDMKDALKASLEGEMNAVTERLAKAEAFFAAREPIDAPAPAAQRVRSATPREKVIRDGFTMPANDYNLIRQIQATCLEVGLSVTKSEVLRAGLHMLQHMPPADLKQVFMALEKVKAGRPAT